MKLGYSTLNSSWRFASSYFGKRALPAAGLVLEEGAPLIRGSMEVAKKAGRNRMVADPLAEGAHTVFRTDPLTNKISHYETFIPQTNLKNPNPWQTLKRFDSDHHHHYHFNKVTKERVWTPHVHDPFYPGEVRPVEFWEIPK
jgi:hypothetical protein